MGYALFEWENFRSLRGLTVLERSRVWHISGNVYTQKEDSEDAHISSAFACKLNTCIQRLLSALSLALGSDSNNKRLVLVDSLVFLPLLSLDVPKLCEVARLRVCLQISADTCSFIQQQRTSYHLDSNRTSGPTPCTDVSATERTYSWTNRAKSIRDAYQSTRSRCEAAH